jgi:hypothetical protein
LFDDLFLLIKKEEEEKHDERILRKSRINTRKNLSKEKITPLLSFYIHKRERKKEKT